MKQKIGLLTKAIKSDTRIDNALKRRKIGLIARFLDTANKYVEVVVRQGLLLQIHEGTSDKDILQDLASVDKSRSVIHDGLISQIAIINRLFEGYGLEPIYQGGDARRDKGDFALELITGYFQDRI